MFNTLLNKLYAASISIDPTGAMLVSSTRDRILAWGLLFCFTSALCLICFLLWRRPLLRKLSILTYMVTLLIPLLIMPAIKREFIRVSEWRLIVDNGTWLPNSRREIDLNNLKKITERREGLLPGNLLGDPGVVWEIHWNDGKREDLELSDFFNAHRMVVAYFVRDHGHAMARLEDPDFSFKVTRVRQPSME